MSLDNRDYMRDNRPGPDIFANITPLKIILAVNIVVFVLQHVFVIGAERDASGQLREFGSLSLAKLADGQIWTLVTHLFVHGSTMHLIGNMMLVYFVGRSLQSLLGNKSFVVLYFLSGFAAAFFQILYQHFIMGAPPTAGMIGASGSAFGLLFAFATIMPNEVFMLIFPIPMKITAKNIARALFVISVAMLIIEKAYGRLTPIAHMAHLGGAVAGLVYARFLGFGGKSRTYGGPTPRSRESKPKRPGSIPAPPRSKVVDAEVVTKSTTDYFSAEIDPILDKINREGMGSLTEKEKKILQQGQRKISKKVDGI